MHLSLTNRSRRNPAVRSRLHARLGFILPLLTMCSQGSYQIKGGYSRRPTRYSRWARSSRAYRWLMLGDIRQAYEELGPSFCLLLSSFQKHCRHRTASWCPQERCNTPNRQNHHQQLDHRRYEGLQVQDAICLCPFSHKCQYREEFGERAFWGWHSVRRKRGVLKEKI